MSVSDQSPLVSIVWYGINRRRHIEEEIAGVLRQSHQNWRLIVVDFGSSDGTLEYFRALSATDARVEVRPHSDTPPGDALLAALRRGDGDYIAFCPVRGEFTPDALAFGIGVLQSKPEAGALACRGLLVDASGEAANVPVDLPMMLFTQLRLSPSSGIIRRAALIESGLPRNDWRTGCLELDLWCRLAIDHDIATSDRSIVVGRPIPEFAHVAPTVAAVDDRMRLIEDLFAKDGFLGDANDLPLQLEGMANQLGIAREDRLGDKRALVRQARALAKRFAHLLSYDPRAYRSMERWRRCWHMEKPLEAISSLHATRAFRRDRDPILRSISFLFRHWHQLTPGFVRAAFPARSKRMSAQEIEQLPACFADFYAVLAERYIAHGQVATSIRHWRLAEPIGDEMCDGMGLQTEIKLPGATEVSLGDVHRRWASRHVGDARPIDPTSLPRWDGRRKIRIGYHCSFMAGDTMRYMMSRVVQAHDHDRFEIYAYSPQPVPPDIAAGFDVIRDTLTTHDDPTHIVFHKTPMMSHEAFHRLVRSDGIDVLVELTGFSPGHRFKAMARRCAPVQVSFLNHTASSQVVNVDYILADEICLPSDAGFEAHYSEQIYRLPGCFFCFDYRGSDYPPIVDPPSLASGVVTFGCFGFGGKLNDSQLAHWAEMLHAIPNSRLHLQNIQMVNERSRRFLAERFRRYGISPDRLVLAMGTSRHDLLKVYGQIDISLDTHPYCGGNTTAEALWNGVPVITLQGDRFSSRYGASLLAAAGCSDLVAQTPQHYIEIARNLASDPVRLKELRYRLRDMSIEHGLGDSALFARRLEAAYVDMLSRLAS